MKEFFWTAILILFLLWCHSLIIRSYRTTANTRNNNTTKKSKSEIITDSLVQLLLLAALFFACYCFINLQNSNQITNKNYRENKTAVNKTTNSDPTDSNSIPHNNTLDYPDDYETNPNDKAKQNKIDIIQPGDIKTRIKDVAGLKEPKEELTDIIDFLKEPVKFKRLGAKPPKGVIMHGPPGTGKTYLARAIAGESHVTFISVSGSQFDEEFIGVGAARVRQLFQLARKSAPCIVFIDEIDSVASNRKRHDTAAASQTVNQLLTEMDGLDDEKNNGIMIIAASNRLESIDPAILRPGRFDRQVKIDLPTISEREEIVNVHIKKITADTKLTNLEIAKMTTGFSGADLANIINEAAIIATKEDKSQVEINDFIKAKEKIVLGTKMPLHFSDSEKLKTAYHEAGHALVGHLSKRHDPLYKVTISPRGKSLGHTSFEPQDDTVSYSKRMLEEKISVLLAGRMSEELVYGKEEVTTGAANDLEIATRLAYDMVTKWGFSDLIGTLYVDNYNDKIISNSTIEKEVKKIIDKQNEVAKELLEKNIDKLHLLSKELCEHETLDRNQLFKLLG